MSILKHAATGKTLAEYALIGFLVVLIAIPGLTVMGEQINAMYSTSAPINKAQPLFDLLSPRNGGESSLAAGSGQATANQDGQKISLSQTSLAGYGSKFSQALVASSTEGILDSLNKGGLDGLTSGMASNLEELVDELEATGELTPEEAAHFRDLSNQGHKIAGIQRILEDAAKKFHGTPDDANFNAFKAQKVVYEGQELTVHKLSMLLDFGDLEKYPDWNKTLASGQIDTSRLSWGNPPGGTNELGRFINMYQDTLDFQAYKDHPALQEYVASLSATVTYSADFSGSYWYSSYDNEAEMKAGITEHFRGDIEKFALKPDQLDEVTDGASEEICTVGEGQDSGRNCR